MDSQVQLGNHGFNETVEQLVDILFRCLKLVFPPSINTMLKGSRVEAAAKRQWIPVFIENGIASEQQQSAGMKRALTSGSPFWPSPGEFIQWCRKGIYSVAGLREKTNSTTW